MPNRDEVLSRRVAILGFMVEGRWWYGPLARVLWPTGPSLALVMELLTDGPSPQRLGTIGLGRC